MTSVLSILARTFRPVAVPEHSPRANPIRSGVYLLAATHDIVYIGSSTDIDGRLSQHAGDRRHQRGRAAKDFDRALWLALPAAVHCHYEGALIRALQPRYNRHAPRPAGYDNEILEGLGLPAHADEVAAAREWLLVRRSRVLPPSRRPRSEQRLSPPGVTS